MGNLVIDKAASRAAVYETQPPRTCEAGQQANPVRMTSRNPPEIPKMDDFKWY